MATKSETKAPETPAEIESETPTETESKMVTTNEEFAAAFAVCLQIATNDLPQVLAQQREGSNPEHQKQIQNLERVITDGTVPPETLAILQAQVEKMKPQLSWSQETVSDMVSIFDSRATSDAEKALVKEVNAEVLRRSAVGSGKGKKAGTSVTRVAGAVKELQLACTLCDFAQPARRSDASTAPYKIANDIRKHMHDPHGLTFNTKQLEETVRQVIAGELPRATIKNEAGEAVFQMAPVAATAPAETPADNGATASAETPAETPVPETV